MASCREIEKMVMPYINHQLDEVQLEQFLKHIKSCSSCREELELSLIHISDNRRRSEQSAKFQCFCVSVRGFRNFGPFSGSVSIFLSGSEDSIACIAQSRADVGVFV